MAVTAADLIAYAAASMPDDDTSTSGGAIDSKRRVVFTEQATDFIEVVSDNAGDTQDCTVVARAISGSVTTDTKALTGTTPVGFGAFEHLLSVDLVSDAVGTVTVRLAGGGATFGTIPAGERGFVRLFRKAASEPSPASRYEKLFIKNTHATLSLLSASVVETADPDSKMSFTLASAVDDINSVANRKTAPGAAIIEPDSFDDAEKSVPGGTLAAGSAIGVWVKQTLDALDSPLESSFTLKIAGESA